MDKNHLGIRKPKSEKSCSPSPPMLVVQSGAEESPAPKLESIDESSSSSTNSVSDKPICFFQSSDLTEMNSVLSLIRSNFPNLNIQVCVGATSATPKTKFLSPSQKQWERAFSMDSSFPNSMDRQESKDSGFWSGGKSSFDSAKSWSMSESYSTSLQTPSPPTLQPKAEHENYLKSPSNRSGFKWKKGQAWRYNSNSSNVSTDCSTNCDEPSTQNTSLNLTSFEAESDQCKDAPAARFSNSFESGGLPPSGLSNGHLWASTSKLDEFRSGPAAKPIVSSFTIGHSMNKAPKRRGKLVREQTIDHQDEQSAPTLTNSTVKLESTRFDSISSLISPLTISSKESASTGHSGRISPPEKRLSINMDKTFSSTPASVCSSPAPPASHGLHEAVVAAMIAATIAKPALNSQTIDHQQHQHYDFYKDLHKLNLRASDESKSRDQYLSTNSGKMVSRSSSSPNYSSSCSSIPSLQNGLTAFAPLLSSFADQYSGKSVSTCSIPVAHFGASRPGNESLRFGARPPEIVITESRVDGEAGEKTGCTPASFQFRPQEPSGWRSVNSEYLSGMARGQSSGEKQAKPHVCPSCQKRFARSDMLIRHSRLHSGVRPYRCNRCGQEFSRSDHLNTHLRTHTGEKPYSCPHPKCTYAACRKDMITRHLKVHNKNKSAAASFDNSGDKAKTLNAEFGKKMAPFPSISFDSAGLNFVNRQSSDKMQESTEANSAAGQTK